MNTLLIGKLIKPYGLKGLLKAIFYVDSLEELDNFSRFFIVNKKELSGFQEIVIEKISLLQGYTIVKIQGCSDRNGSELLANKEIFVDSEEIPALKKGLYYIKDLFDADVFEKDVRAGKVNNVLLIANRTMLILKMQNGREIAVPFNDRYIDKVDIVKKIVYARDLAEFY